MADKIYIRRGNIADIPTLAQGEPGFALDTKKLYIGTATGNQGIVSSAPTLATWIAPTLLNSWVNFGGGAETVGYYKDDLGIVRLRGLIKSGITTPNTILFALPSGYRPLFTVTGTTLSNSGATDSFSYVSIDSGGNVSIQLGGNTYFRLDNITFRAEQ